MHLHRPGVCLKSGGGLSAAANSSQVGRHTFAASAVFSVRRSRRAIRDRRIPAGPELAGSSGRIGYRRRSFSLGSLLPGAAYAEAYGTIFPPFRGIGRCDPCVRILYWCPGAPLGKNLSGGD